MVILFLAFIDWAVPIAGGLLIGLLIASRKPVDLSQIVTLDVEEFRLNMRKGQLIDIRPKEVYEKSHISGARNFPKKSVLGELHRLRADQAVFIVGISENGIARKLAKKLYKKGIHPIYILKNGLNDWTYPLKEQ